MRPVTDDQWQDAVDTAEFLSRVDTADILLCLELGKLFELVNDDYEIDIQACLNILEDGLNIGITPRHRAIHPTECMHEHRLPKDEG